MKGIILLSNYFEDTEAISTIDVLRRGNLDITLVSLGNSLKLITQHNLIIYADCLLENINYKEYDFLIIPGGKHVVKNLYTNPYINDIILDFNQKKKLIASICAAPSILAKLGLFKNSKYTCYEGFEIYDKDNYVKENVVVSNNFITAKGMYYTIDFALEILKYLNKKEEYNKLIKDFL